jgi:hypothetical protein
LFFVFLGNKYIARSGRHPHPVLILAEEAERHLKVVI